MGRRGCIGIGGKWIVEWRRRQEALHGGGGQRTPDARSVARRGTPRGRRRTRLGARDVVRAEASLAGVEVAPDAAPHAIPLPKTRLAAVARDALRIGGFEEFESMFPRAVQLRRGGRMPFAFCDGSRDGFVVARAIIIIDVDGIAKPIVSHLVCDCDACVRDATQEIIKSRSKMEGLRTA